MMFFTVKLLHLLERLIIHGNLKIDNCLEWLENVPGGTSCWATQYDPVGAHRRNCKGIKLINFGHRINTQRSEQRVIPVCMQ